MKILVNPSKSVNLAPTDGLRSLAPPLGAPDFFAPMGPWIFLRELGRAGGVRAKNSGVPLAQMPWVLGFQWPPGGALGHFGL